MSQSYLEIGLRSGALLVFLLVAAWYLNLSRGVGVMFLFFLVLVVIANFALTRTRWGRAVYAVGGSVEAARRAGIRVDRIYISVFVLCSTSPPSAASSRPRGWPPRTRAPAAAT